MADPKPEASPDLLAKPTGFAAVRRLNRNPLVILFGIGSLIAFVVVFAMHLRAPGAAAPPATDAKANSAKRLAEHVVEGQTLGVIGGETAPKPEAPDVKPDGEGDLEMAPLTEITAENDVVPNRQAPTPRPPSRIEQQVRQRHLQLLWQRHDQMIKGTQAETRVDFGTPGTATTASPAFDPAAEFQRTLAGAAAQLGQAAGSGPEDPNQQAHKQAFLQQARPSGALLHQRQPPLSPYELKTGTVIPAVMITGINSDLPGVITAQVSQHVWDTATGQHLLIPQGTKLFGTYDSAVSFGQKRVLVAWSRLIFPDASTLELDTMPGADQAGYAGFKDRVDRHLLRIFGSAVLLSVVGATFEISQPDSSGDNPTPQQQAAAQLGQELGQVSREQIRREMDVQPTLVIRPGYRFNVMVNQDMTLEPYRFGGVQAAR